MGATDFSLEPRLVTALQSALPLLNVIETGTFEGDSAAQLAALRPSLAEASVLYWLNSPARVAAELATIDRLNPLSVVAIADARLFLPPAPPPPFDALARSLRLLNPEHELIVLNDVILFIPPAARPALEAHALACGVNLLCPTSAARRALRSLLASARWTRAASFAQLHHKLYKLSLPLILPDGHPLGPLAQHPPRPLVHSITHPAPSGRTRFCLLTPSYQQGRFLERTLLSVLDQNYPALRYAVQDGGSTDESVSILDRHRHRLAFAVSAPDRGQADAIHQGFTRLAPAPDEIMGWLNSDDLLLPGSLAAVAVYFEAHPEVDVVYGHRVLIDESDREIGRWYLPPHRPHTLALQDYVPQETLFWRASAYHRVGGIDPAYQFALDWDLLLRFQAAGLRFKRLPRFLGCFRVHQSQKTSSAMHTTGAEEMRNLRFRHLGRHPSDEEIRNNGRREQRRSTLVQLAWRLGLRY